MDKERYDDLMDDVNGSLTDEEMDAGWHFCTDWDGLLIHDSWEEAEACTCQ